MWLWQLQVQEALAALQQEKVALLEARLELALWEVRRRGPRLDMSIIQPHPRLLLNGRLS